MMMEEESSIAALYCTICGHDLNNVCYLVCQHPILPVPVCILCMDDLENRLNEIVKEDEGSEMENYCNWCIECTGVLYLCGTESDNLCNHAFCRECLVSHFGEQFVQNIDNRSYWRCLVCDPSPLNNLKSALDQGRSLSIYADSFSVDFGVDSCDNDLDKEVAADIYKLQMVVAEVEEATRMLEHEHIDEKDMQIREEMLENADKQSRGSIATLAKEELQLYINSWQRHFDIMQRQEADLCEKISYHGYDLTSLPMYDVDGSNLRKNINAHERSSYEAADAVIMQRSSHQVSNQDSDELNEIDSPNEDSGEIATQMIEAENNDIVLKYSKQPDIPRRNYPAEFRQLLPESILKALYYSHNSAETEQLVESFGIPAHVRIVLKYASERLPRSAKMWSIADQVHPAVLKAIFFSTMAERSLLCDFYDLDPELCGITDCGSTSELFELYNRRLAERKGKDSISNGELSLREMLESEEAEDMDLQQQQEKLDNLYEKKLCGRKSGSSSSSGKRGNDRRLQILTSYKADEEDEEDLEAQRASILKTAGTILKETKDRAEKRIRWQEKKRSLQNDSSKEKLLVISPRAKSAMESSPTSKSKASHRNRSTADIIEDDGDDDFFRDDSLMDEAQSSKEKSKRKYESRSPAVTIPSDSDDQKFPKRKYNKLKKNSSSKESDSSSNDDLDEPILLGSQKQISKTEKDVLLRRDKDNFKSSEQLDAKQALSGESVMKDWFESNDSRSNHYNSMHKVFEVICEQQLFDVGSPFSLIWDTLELMNNWRIVSTSAGTKIYTHLPTSFPPDKILSFGRRKMDYFTSEKEVLRFVLKNLSRQKARLEKKSTIDEKSAAKESQPRHKSNEASTVVQDSDIVDLTISDAEIDRVSKPKLDNNNSPRSKRKRNEHSDDEATEDNGSCNDSDWKSPPEKEALTMRSPEPLSIKKTQGSRQTTLSFSAEKKPSQSRQSSDALPKKWKLSEESLVVKKEEFARRSERRSFAHFSEKEDSGFTINIDRPTNEPAVKVLDGLAAVLKAHQKDGVRVIWNNVVVSLNSCKTSGSGRGCILAHSMGLGKTLTVVSFLVTALSHPVFGALKDPIQTNSNAISIDGSNKLTEDNDQSATEESENQKNLFHSILIVAPKNTLQNWMNEFDKWTPPDLRKFTSVCNIDAGSTATKDRIKKLRQWHSLGGVMIISYEMYRNMTYLEDATANSSKKTTAKSLTNVKKGSIDDLTEARRYLVNPGPDLVVADEAHVIKESKSKVHMALNEIRTKRRIALTGTPLQNNLEEYFCMVNWVRNRFLGSRKEFRKRFIVPIRNGQSKDATKHELQHMKKRSHVLHKKLKEIVHRVDMSQLAQDLKPMRQFIIVVKMTDFQRFMYRLYLSKLSQAPLQTRKTSLLLQAYQALLRVWNHPGVTVLNHLNEKCKVVSQQSLKAKATQNFKQSRSSSLAAVAKALTPVIKYFEMNKAGLNAELDASVQVEDALLGGNEVKEEKISDLDGDDLEDADFDEEQEWETPKVSKQQPTVTCKIGDTCYIKLSQLLENDSILDSHIHTLNESIKVLTIENFCLKGSIVRLYPLFVQVIFLQCDIQCNISMEYYKSLCNSALPQGMVELDRTILEDPLNDWLLTILQNRCEKLLDFEDSKPNGTANANLLQISADNPALVASDWWMLKDSKSISESLPVIEPSATSSDNVSAGKVVEISAVNNLNSISIDGDELTQSSLLRLGNKIVVFLSLLALSVADGEKMILFSQSLDTLNTIELFLMMENWGDALLTDNADQDIALGAQSAVRTNKFSRWTFGKDYLRIDGTTVSRQPIIDEFNKSDHTKLLLISTKAGNMGINLQAASRVVLFDASWNPAHDLQAIFRAYRYGQQKSVFVYRLLASGTMEEKIHMRQVDKQTLAARVVDAQMPDNHFTTSQTSQLMDFRESESLEKTQEAILEVLSHGTQDQVLRKLVDKTSKFLFPSLLASIEDQGSLLEDNIESHLNEQERAAAEEEFEKEVALELAPPLQMPQALHSGGALSSTQSTQALIAKAYAQSQALLATQAAMKAPVLTPSPVSITNHLTPSNGSS